MNFKKEELKNHSVAPYNFVSLPEVSYAPYKSMDELPKHNDLKKELLNGTIEYEIEALTPLLVAGDKKDGIKFFTNPKNEKVIPGNTIRGLLRTNAAILSMSNISDDIIDERFFFRSFGKTITPKEYKERLNINSEKEGKASYTVAKEVKSGFIYKRGERDYIIIPSNKIQGKQYFRISEPYIRIMKPNVKVNYMYNNKTLDIIKFKEKYKGQSTAKKDLLNSNQDRKYKPYFTEISFKLKDKRTIKEIGNKNKLEHNGFLISSNHVYGKLAHYVIAEPDFQSNEIIELNDKTGLIKFIELYKDDYIRTKKTDDFFKLPEKVGKEKGKPIFYAEIKGNIYIGFSQYFRIAYDQSVKDGIASRYKNNKEISYCDAVFGFVNKNLGTDSNKSYKGRISVEDAKYIGEVPSKIKIERKSYYDVILGEPHASCYTTYLKQKNNAGLKNLKTYNSANFTIGGIKQYWQKEYVETVPQDKLKANVASRLIPINNGSKFKGKIHFNNFTEDELGLLLWALKVKENATENIGMGKPYGFGRINIDKIKVNIDNLEKKYSSMSMNFNNEVNREEYITKYKKNFLNRFKVNLDTIESIKELIVVKTTVINKNRYNEARYMDITSSFKIKNEFTRGLPLLSIEEQSKELQFNKK